MGAVKDIVTGKLYLNHDERPRKLSIITATWNAMEVLPRLVESLRQQDDKDFEWIVADGASTDGTFEYLQTIDDLDIKVICQEDFGIYDALNRGIKACNGEFYLVMGADDELYSNGVKDYKNAMEDGVDVVTGWVDSERGVMKPNTGPAWLKGQFSYVSGHAVGAVFRKSLHEEYGYYSRKLPIAADQLFILTIAKARVNIKPIVAVVGRFSDEGVSTVDVLGVIVEFFRAQVLVGESRFLQVFLFILRLLKNFKKVMMNAK